MSMIKKAKLKLMADYNSNGLWSEHVDTDILFRSLSVELQIYIKHWISFYSDNIDWRDPNNKGWDPMHNKKYWDALISLEELVFSKVEEEIGKRYNIEYVKTCIPADLKSKN